MKSRLIILVLLVFSLNLEAQVRRTTIRAFWQTIRNTITGETPPTPIIEKAFYVSSTYGNDSNPGTLEEPFQTLNKINSLALNDTLKVYLKRGDSFVGSLTAQSDSIIYDSYGTGDKPIIYGSQPITGWTQRGSSNIYVKYFPTTVTQLFEDDERMTEARYPNTGYDYIETVNSTTSFTSTQLNASVDYTGAKWLGRTELYKMSTKTISGSSGQTLSFATAPDGGLTVTTEGFILVGLLSLLDEAGEWCYNTTNDTLYFWSSDGADPDIHSIRATTEDYGIEIDGKNVVTVKNIEFKHQNLAGVYLYNSDYDTIYNNSFIDQDATAIGSSGLSSSNHLTISKNTIKGANHYGIELYSSYSTITDNIVDSTAIFTSLGSSGMGASYAGSSYYIEGTNGYNHILYNQSKNAGYNGIHFYGGHTTVEYNYLYNSMLTKDDGGAIYTSSAISPGGSIIRYNIVDGSYGTFNGFTKYAYTLGEGIYLDESSDSVTVNNNVVSNINGGSYYQHKGRYHDWNNNLSYRAKDGFAAKLVGLGSSFTYNKIYGFSRDMNDRQSERMVNFTAVANNPTVNNNTYVNHYKSADIFYTFVSPTETTYSLSGWQSATSQDAGSTIDNSALTDGHQERLIYNETKSTKTFYLNSATNVTDAFSDASVTDTFSLAPFTGKVLEGENLNCILDYSDSTAPTITAFTLPTTSAILVEISSFTATGATEYIITESATEPELSNINWTTAIPTNYTFYSNGEKTLYAWAKDAAGNISSYVSDNITIASDEVVLGFNTQYATNSTSTVRRAMPVTFAEDGLITSVSFYHGGGTGTCLVGVYSDDTTGPDLRLAISEVTTLNVSASWNTVNLITPIFVTSGTTYWIAVTPSIGGLKYEAALPYRAQAGSGDYTNGLPLDFGPFTLTTGRYSIYCTYLSSYID